MSKADRKAHRALFEDTSKVIRRAEKLVQSLEAMLSRRGDHKASTDLLNVVQGSLKNLRKDAVALDKLGWPKKGDGTKAASSPAKTSKAPPRKGPKAVATKRAKTETRRSRVKKTPASAGSAPDLKMATPVQ